MRTLPARERDCTCLGSCKGSEALAPGWKCALRKAAAKNSDEVLREKIAGDAVDRAPLDEIIGELTDLALDSREVAVRAFGTDREASLQWIELGFDLDEVLAHVLRLRAAESRGGR